MRRSPVPERRSRRRAIARPYAGVEGDNHLALVPSRSWPLSIAIMLDAISPSSSLCVITGTDGRSRRIKNVWLRYVAAVEQSRRVDRDVVLADPLVKPLVAESLFEPGERRG